MSVVASAAPFIVLLGAILNAVWGRRLGEPGAGYTACGAAALAFIVSLLGFLGIFFVPERSLHVPLWRYLSAGNFTLDLGFRIDPLSLTMMLIITGVGLLIHIYSLRYMERDPGFSRFFAVLNLFVAAMLILVMADSFLLMFVGWEGVGVCSYLLIGFWYALKENADAARKAFIVNRIGDVGFLLAMFLCAKTFGTLDIATINAYAPQLAGSAVLAAIGLLFLLAAAGKSAQLPLHVWLPDAMAGPTPVSALIHAATMVTAGVYLMVRAAPLFASSPTASAVIAWVGALTAFMAAFSALAQTDIKKILAYSTISQLGFMFAAVGAGAYWVALFHVFTHAFFKALLFLAAGAVIHALAGEQDVRKMGALHKHMRITSLCSLVAVAAISGVPLFSGFFSKDAILTHILASELLRGYGALLLYALLLATAVLTAFYMFRWYYLVFGGTARFARNLHPHEAPLEMRLPLIILAFFSAFAGFLGLPQFAFPNLFAPWLNIETTAHFRHFSAATEWLFILLSVLAAALGLGFGYWRYHLSGKRAQRAALVFPKRLKQLSAHAWYVDAFYARRVTRPAEVLASRGSRFDNETLSPGVPRWAGQVSVFAKALERLQSGYVRLYALLMFFGLMALVLSAVIGQVAS